MTRVSLSEQIRAVEAAQRIVTGAERVPARAAERDYAGESLGAAAATLRWLGAHEYEIRAAVSAKGRAEARDGAAARDRTRHYGDLPLGQQAALRCGNAAFQKFMHAADALEAAEAVRRDCEVRSRAEFDKDAAAGARWRALDQRFAAWLHCVDASDGSAET